MENDLKNLREDVRKLMSDVSLIKELLFDERELSEWSKQELESARVQSEDDYISIENLKKEIEDDL